jgi:SNF2 family DNA or RNA helicase
MPATLTKDGDTLYLDLSTARGVEFKDALEKVREIPGRRWDPETKFWSVPADSATADRVLHSIQPELSDELLDWIKQERIKASEALTTPLPEDAEVQCPLADVLYPYQRAFVDLAAKRKHVINADDMGLGKTIQALAAVQEYQHRNAQDDGTGAILPDGPKLIVCPNSVKGVWAREIVKWLGPETPHQIIDGATPAKRHAQLLQVINENGWAIVNYEQLRVEKESITIKHRNGQKSTKKVEVMKQPLFQFPFLARAEPSLDDLDYRVQEKAKTSKHREEWFAVIADEVHRAKNRRASQTKGLHRVDGLLKLGQTGTPLMNAPDELWSILHWLFPQEYSSYWRFYETYVEYTEGYFGKVITGVRNPDALRFELRERLVRRTKGQVLDLPEKTRMTVPVTLSAAERKLYDEVVSQVWIDLKKESEDNDVLARAIEAGDLSALLKIPNGAARMVRCQQALEHPSNIDSDRAADSSKMKAMLEIIEDNRSIQHVCFFKFKHSVSLFADMLRDRDFKVGIYTGDTDPSVRTSLEDQFQRGELDIMIGTLSAMKEGITLTAGSTAHFCSRSWVPAENEQAEDRLHRNGQHDPVTIYIYEVEDTVDTGKVRPTNRRKSAIVSTVLVKDEVQESRHA